MKIEYDPIKSDKNDSERGLPFCMAADFEWDTAVYIIDDRRNYGETRRIRAFGFINERLHSLAFTPIEGGVRIISLRRANQREVRNYEKTKTGIN